MATWLAILYWARRLMRGLIFVTWAIWGLHTLLWLFRALKDRKQIRAHLKPVSGRWYRRWPWTYRAIHLTLVFSFLLLALTGLPTPLPRDAGWSQDDLRVLGGPEKPRGSSTGRAPSSPSAMHGRLRRDDPVARLQGREGPVPRAQHPLPAPARTRRT